MDDVIRDLAKAHGSTDIPDSKIREIRTQLSNAYIDDVLDGRYGSEEKPEQQLQERGA